MREPITIVCGICRKEYTVEVTRQDLEDFNNGKSAQRAFPYLPPAERELLISATCDPCFDEMFPPEDD